MQQTNVLYATPKDAGRLENARLAVEFNECDGSPAAMVFDGHRVPCGEFPVFDILQEDGVRVMLKADDPALRIEIDRTGGAVSVRYAMEGQFAAEIEYRLAEDGLDIHSRVTEEAGAKVIAVGDALFALTPSTAPPGFTGAVLPEFSGRLLTFASTPADYHSERLQSAKYLGNFFALSFADTGVIVRPAHFSAEFYYGVGPEEIRAGLRQYFRPEQTVDFAMPLCHEERTLRLVFATPEPQPQDWREIALCYRRRFIKPNETKSPLYRDGITSSAGMTPERPNLADYLPLAARVNYADFSLWLCAAHCPKNVNLDHLYWDFIPDITRGDYLQFKQAAAAYGWRPHIHQDMDLVTEGRGWQEQYVRRFPDGRLWQEGEWGGRKSYFRSYSAFRDRWEPFMTAVFDRWDVQPGDLWHDDVNGWFWWEDYSVEHPSTRDMDLQIRRELWEFCRRRGVGMSDECLMEGMTDLNDYSHWTFCYEAGVNDRIPMMPLLFLGNTYYAFACCESVPGRDERLPPINYAYALLAGVKFGITVREESYDLFAEAYFKNNLPWSFIADAFVETLEQDGETYTLTYSNGVTLVTCPADNTFTMTIGGVDYATHTPLNAKGFMAAWADGVYPLAPGCAAPLHTHLWQNHGETELCGAVTELDSNGRATIQMTTSLSPKPDDVRQYMRARQGADNGEYLDTPDMVVLRQMPVTIRCDGGLRMAETASPENEYRFAVTQDAAGEATFTMTEKGWGVRLYTEENAPADWTRKLTVRGQAAFTVSFHPYIYGER